MELDRQSTFSYDDDNLTNDSFSLTQLTVVASTQFGQPCVLSKLAQGGYHKVYEVFREDGVPLGAVLRVASPAFPKDKLESEVAVLKLIASRTTIPVPQVYTWNSDRTNPVGAEYMIMEKIRGVPASSVWYDLALEKKKVTIGQLGKHMVELFAQRFTTGGSLYLSPHSEFTVGPIVIPHFYRALDGDLRIPPDEWDAIRQERDQFRGPFNTITDYLLCAVKAELDFLDRHREIAYMDAGDDLEKGKEAVELGESVLRKALELFPLFPGDMPVYSPDSAPDKPFSILLDDFHLANIMIDPDTGDVTGLIDFEGTRVAPAWACPIIPGWILEPNHEDMIPVFPTDDDQGVRAVLKDMFMEAVRTADPSGEWERAYEAGRPYRFLLAATAYFVIPWGYRKDYVNHMLDWCKTHPGEAYKGSVDPIPKFKFDKRVIS